MNKSIGSLQDKIWDEKFELLIEYLKTHNNKYPSQKSKDSIGKKLGIWSLRIRSDYKKGLLNEYRLNKLKSINFPFEPYEYRWDEFYKKLKKWFVTNEEFPSRSDDEDIYNWLINQIDKFVNDTLDESKRKLLEELNFQQFVDGIENKKTDEEIWEDTFQEVRKFKELNDCFPIYGKKNKNEIESRLGAWLIAQRQKNKKGKLTEEQKQKLTDIGFEWKDASELNAEIWDRTFQELKTYFMQHKSWPKINEGKLGQWCAAQRVWYKGQSKNNSEYPKERIEKLDSIGFPWELRDETWDDNVQKVKDYFVENNTNMLPTSINGETNVLYT